MSTWQPMLMMSLFSLKPLWSSLRKLNETMIEYYLSGKFHSVREPNGTLKVDNDDPEHHLSAKWLKEDVRMAVSAKTYIENAIDRLERMLGVTLFATFKLSPREDRTRVVRPSFFAELFLDELQDAKVKNTHLHTHPSDSPPVPGINFLDGRARYIFILPPV